MIVVKNTHEAIVSQELWDRVREMEQSVSQGKPYVCLLFPISLPMKR